MSRAGRTHGSIPQGTAIERYLAHDGCPLRADLKDGSGEMPRSPGRRIVSSFNITAIHFTGSYVRSASVERKAYVYSCSDGWGAGGKAEVIAGSVDEFRIALDII